MYILSYVHKLALYPERYLVPPRCTLFRLLPANSLFVRLVNLFVFISLF